MKPMKFLKELILSPLLQGLLLCLLISGKVFSLETTIVGIYPHADDRDLLAVWVSYNGQIFSVRKSNSSLIEDLYRARNLKLVVELETQSPIPYGLENSNEEIIHVTLLDPINDSEEFHQRERLSPLRDFRATNLRDYSHAAQVFNTLNNKTKLFTQCYARAHIWAREMEKNFGILSKKVLIYYTARFHREVNKKWWFHIAPVVKAGGAEYVMDRSFLKSPVTLKQWEQIFTEQKNHTHINCKPILKISEFYDRENQKNEYCNIQIVNMYHWEPNDIRKLEDEGLERRSWQNWEIRWSLKNSFRGWRSLYEELKI